ncbi:MAG: NIL domain-containing protein [Verrucomicrobia bacterium]|nr:NIL domain-containing protein [Verrucomicrobiota bacterium]MBI3869906.1 NIL domain-containing protein [Verrucomicrobiota bacterium]
MPAPRKKQAPQRKTPNSAQESRRFWLTYPPKLIQSPVIWELAQKFEVVSNIRQASVSDVLGILCLELEGRRSVIKKAVRWLEKQGVSVEPVEINVIES